jgi:heptaprenyl diphosphate synthase
MFALRRIPGPGRLSLAGIGVAGAVASNGTQLVLARFLVFGPGVRFLIPPFLAAGLVTGLALGLFCERFRSRSRWYSSRLNRQPRGKPGPEYRREGEPPGIVPAVPAAPLRRKRFAGFLEGKGPAAAGLLMGAAFLLNPSLPFRVLQFLFFWLCALAAGRKQRPLLTLSVIAAVILVNLLAPYGRVLAEIGPLKITGGSLAAGLRKGISLEGLLMLSGAVISCGALDSLYRPRPGHGGGLSRGSGPGGFGGLLGESFRLFGKIGEKKGRIKAKQVIEGIDTLLLELEEEEEEAEDTGKRKTGGGEGPGKNRGRLLLFLGTPLVVALTLLPLL